MPENSETTAADLKKQGFDHKLVVNATRAAVLSLMLADLRLRTQQSPSGLAQKLSRHVLIAPVLRARLQFVARVDENRKIFFGLARRNKTEKVADVRVNLELRPKAPLSPERASELAMVFAMPDFVVNPGDPSSLTLQLKKGRRLPIALNKPRTDKSKSNYADVAIMLMEWVRLGALHDLYALKLDQESDTQDLITTVNDNFGEIWSIDLTGTGRAPTGSSQSDRAIWKDIVAAQTFLKKIDSFLAGDYEFSALRARALIMLGPDGRLVKRIGTTGARQVDLEVGLGSAAGRQVAVLKMSIPDILVTGPRCAEFASKFADLAGDDVWKQLKNSSEFSKLDIKLDRDDVARLVSGDNKQLSFIRLEANANGVDDDLIIVQGTLSGVPVTLLWTAKLKVTDYPDITVEKISNLKLLAGSRLDAGWNWIGNPNDEFFDYFESLLRMLRDWQNLAGAPVPRSQVA